MLFRSSPPGLNPLEHPIELPTELPMFDQWGGQLGRDVKGRGAIEAAGPRSFEQRGRRTAIRAIQPSCRGVHFSIQQLLDPSGSLQGFEAVVELFGGLDEPVDRKNRTDTRAPQIPLGLEFEQGPLECLR